MAKFKKGDKVVNTEINQREIPDNAIGTVMEDSRVPFVMWECNGAKFKWAQYEEFLKLAKEPRTATLEIYPYRGGFRYRKIAANGKILNHHYNTVAAAKKGAEAERKFWENYKIVKK